MTSSFGANYMVASSPFFKVVLSSKSSLKALYKLSSPSDKILPGCHFKKIYLDTAQRVCPVKPVNVIHDIVKFFCIVIYILFPFMDRITPIYDLLLKSSLQMLVQNWVSTDVRVHDVFGASGKAGHQSFSRCGVILRNAPHFYRDTAKTWPSYRLCTSCV